MTTPAAPYDDAKLRQALRVYADHPLGDGDVVLLLDDAVFVELEQLADTWDGVLRRNTGQVLRESDVELLPVRALPAA